MLKNWTSHADYLHLISDAVLSLNDSHRKKLTSYSFSLAKLASLNLDPLAVHLAPYYSHKLLQEIFSLIALVPSIDLGLIPVDNLTVAGDGTCVHSHCDALGTKVCDCKKKGYPLLKGLHLTEGLLPPVCGNF